MNNGSQLDYSQRERVVDPIHFSYRIKSLMRINFEILFIKTFKNN